MYTGVSSVEFRSMADGDTLLTFWWFSMVFQERSNKFDEVQLSKCLPKNRWWFYLGLWFGFPIGFHHRFHGLSMCFSTVCPLFSTVFPCFSMVFPRFVQRFPWIQRWFLGRCLDGPLRWSLGCDEVHPHTPRRRLETKERKCAGMVVMVVTVVITIIVLYGYMII